MRLKPIGETDVAFWRSIYKLEEGSGGPYTTGWIAAFFPYLVDRHSGRATMRNPFLGTLLHPADDEDRFRPGPTTDEFPGALAAAPFIWEYLYQRFEMQFLGGFVGVRQDHDTLRLTPEVGWAVREAPAATEPR